MASTRLRRELSRTLSQRCLSLSKARYADKNRGVRAKHSVFGLGENCQVKSRRANRIAAMAVEITIHIISTIRPAMLIS